MKFKELLNYLFDDNEITITINYKVVIANKEPRRCDLTKFYDYKVDKMYPDLDGQDELSLRINLVEDMER